jgi:hypothetical protein
MMTPELLALCKSSITTLQSMSVHVFLTINFAVVSLQLAFSMAV